MKKITFVIAVFALTLTITGSAMAGTSADPYLNDAGQVQGQVQGGEKAASTGGSLPFTGLDLLLVAGGGLVLLGAGIAMRRLTPGTKSA